ncbi:alkane 1-monooxygenase [Dokdonia sp. Hel_I_53]|uniref:alkane 1-monooxygenase n=1 Tax=Dokdonia sp. Hel_I_53 TaxID=1566287 RepID=UPI00119A0623|nr:alkane 1-monooxygenase [Dokdonia sp. Hel_I_53]TVZ52646.1 alkane 1-monooxygenase [Dokdonia sp. Hel_I_53]
MKDLKYLTAYTIPLCAFIGLTQQGVFVWLTPVYVFILVPILESIFPVNTINITEVEKEPKKNLHWTDALLYLNLIIVYGTLLLTLQTVANHELTLTEVIGLVFSCGIVIGSNGINVAHELGHRKTKIEQFMGKLLLLPALYMHFFIEHNHGHHLNVGTPKDPATAKYKQTVYAFWISSVYKQYLNSWKIQMNLLHRSNDSFFSIKNDMLWYLLIQGSYLATSYWFFGTQGVVIVICAAIAGFLLLETINYIEHYGLKRNKTASGRYERVREVHSWNSNHIFGRILLYELTRHSDHHYRASKKYQLLDYHDVSPQLPYGYPTSMVLSLVPPLWFSIMNKRIPKDQLPH